MAARRNPTRDVIVEAIDLVVRYGLELTPDNVWKNVKVDGLTLADANETLRRTIKRDIPLVLKETGHIITDASTRARKNFWEATVDEVEEQLRIKEEGSTFDQNRILADRAVVAFLREKEQMLGYEVYPGLFHGEIERIYAMHGIGAPA